MYCDRHEGLEPRLRCGRLAGHEPPCAVNAQHIVAQLRAAYDAHACMIRHVPSSLDYDIVRTTYRKLAENAAITLARDLLRDTEGTLTTDQIIAVANRGSTLRGYTHTGITYHNVPDLLVGEYVPARDDSFAPGWVQPRWVDGEMIEGAGAEPRTLASGQPHETDCPDPDGAHVTCPEPDEPDDGEGDWDASNHPARYGAS
jgi:hypothetical protein